MVKEITGELDLEEVGTDYERFLHRMSDVDGDGLIRVDPESDEFREMMTRIANAEYEPFKDEKDEDE